MFKCPYTTCCSVFDGAAITANLNYFSRGVCPKCGNQIEINFDVNDYAPKTPAAAPAAQPDWSSFTVAELKTALKTYNLSTAGKKSVLIDRLEFYYPKEEDLQ